MGFVGRGRLRSNGDYTAQTGPQVRLPLTNSRLFAAVGRRRGGRRENDGEAGGEGQQSVWRRVARRQQSGRHCGGTTGLRATSGSKKMLLGAVNNVGGSLRVCAGLGRDSSGFWGRQKAPSRAASSPPPPASRATGGMGII